MLRFHFTFNKDRMAQWLNSMDREGWQLKRTAAGFCTFEPAAPGTWDYQIDYGALNPTYRELMQDLGVQIVCRWGPWVVLRRSAGEGPFVLYTDAASRADHLKRVLKFFRVMAALELLCSILLLGMGIQEQYWWMIAVSVIGFAAAMGMITRVRDILEELTQMGFPAGRSPDKCTRYLIASGCLCMLICFLLGDDASQLGVVSNFMKGAGIVLCSIGVFRILTACGD